MSSTDSRLTEQNGTLSLDFGKILHSFRKLLKRFYWAVLLMALLCAGLMAFRSHRSWRPYYESQALLAVYAEYSSATDITKNSNYYDNAAAQQIINTFNSIVATDAMTEMIMDDLGAPYINGSITPSSIASSNLFTITVRSADPQDAYDILCSVLEHYPTLATLVVGSAQLRVIEEPRLPTAPINPLSLKNSILRGLILGSVITLLFLLLLALFTRTVRSSSDVKQFTSIPCLGLIPYAAPKRRVKNTQVPLSLLSPAVNAFYAEAIQSAAARLQREAKEGLAYLLLVTSTLPAEGKSTTAANLALALASTGSRVILVDADLRLQTLNRFFSLSQESKGLPELLSGEEEDALAMLSAVPGSTLQLLSSSRSVPMPHSLLKEERIRTVLEQLRSAADYVIVDTPPIHLLADAHSFLRHADAVLYVIRSDYADVRQIRGGLQALADSGSIPCSYVLNGVSGRLDRYGYNYRYGYGYGYGYSKYGYSRYGSTSSKKSRRKE